MVNEILFRNKTRGDKLMSYVYNWNLSDGGLMVVEYCYSTVDKCLKVVEMNLNGKFHRINWMSHEGREQLMSLLKNAYEHELLHEADTVQLCDLKTGRYNNG